MWNPGQIGKCTISTKLPLPNPYRCLKNITVPSYLTIPLYTTLPYCNVTKIKGKDGVKII